VEEGSRVQFDIRRAGPEFLEDQFTVVYIVLFV